MNRVLPTTMPAYGFAHYGGPEVQDYFTAPVPVPGAGQVLIEVAASGLNPADIKVRQGKRAGVFGVEFPMAMGRECSGTVVAVGSGVNDLRVGDEVFGHPVTGTGSLAAYALLDEAATPKPASVSHEEAACIPVSLGTALDILDHLRLGDGDTLVVIGAGGGVGSGACQLAVSRGVRVVGVASAAKQELVTGFGATHVPSGEEWVERTRSAAAGPVSALLDLVGGDVLHEGLSLCGDETQVVSLADPVQAGQVGGTGVVRRRTRAAYAAAAQSVVDGKVQPVIGAAVPFDHAAEAVALVEQGHAVGNVVVTLTR